jgi:hypothetical protein
VGRFNYSGSTRSWLGGAPKTIQRLFSMAANLRIRGPDRQIVSISIRIEQMAMIAEAQPSDPRLYNTASSYHGNAYSLSHPAPQRQPFLSMWLLHGNTLAQGC